MTLLEDIEHNSLINETLEDILYYLREDRGISSQVINTVAEIENLLRTDIERTQSEPYNVNYVTYKHGQIETSVFKRKIVIKWLYYSFATEDLKNKTRVRATTGKLIKNVGFYEMEIVIKAVLNKIDMSRTLETIQHELEHLWENICKGEKPYKDMDIYRYGHKLMNDKINEYNYFIGNILYLSKEWEQRAYANGVYQYLMNSPHITGLREVIKDTELYCALYMLKIGVKKLKEIGAENWSQHPFVRVTIAKLEKDYGITYEKLIKIGEQAIENITRILGRTLSKAEDDINKKYGLDEPNYREKIINFTK